MAVITEVPATPVQLSGAAAAINSLASSTYVSAGIIDMSTIKPTRLDVEVTVTPGTVATPFKVDVFAMASMDGTKYTTGPLSGTTATDEPNLNLLGTIPCNTNATLQRQIFDIGQGLGFIPPYTKIVLRNTTGAALASSGNDVYYTSYTGLVA